MFFLLCLWLSSCAGNPSEYELPSKTCAVYMGDAQSIPENMYDYSEWGTLVNTAHNTAQDADTLILGGDMVNEDTDEREWDVFFSSGGRPGDVFDRVLPAAGNHVSDRNLLCERFGTDAPEIGVNGLFYIADIGNIRFLILDSVTMGSHDEKNVSVVSQWLEECLSGCPENMWKIAVMHHPMYPASGNFKDLQRAETMQENYLPILREYGVSAILCGHEHVNTRSADGGIIQIIGVSGPKRYSVTDADSFDFVYTDGPAFTVISADELSLTLETFSADGVAIDRTDITR